MRDKSRESTSSSSSTTTTLPATTTAASLPPSLETAEGNLCKVLTRDRAERVLGAVTLGPERFGQPAGYAYPNGLIATGRGCYFRNDAVNTAVKLEGFKNPALAPLAETLFPDKPAFLAPVPLLDSAVLYHEPGYRASAGLRRGDRVYSLGVEGFGNVSDAEEARLVEELTGLMTELANS